MAFGLEKQLPRLNIAAANYMAVNASRGHRLHCGCLTSKATSLVSSSAVWTLFLFDLRHWEPAWGKRRSRCWCVTMCSSLMLRGWNATQGQKNIIYTSCSNLEKASTRNGFLQSLNEQVFLERQPHAIREWATGGTKKGRREGWGEGLQDFESSETRLEVHLWCYCLLDLGHSAFCILFFSSSPIRPLFPFIDR